MLKLVEKLVAHGLAYVRKGDVYFRVRGYRDYGLRCRAKNIDDLKEGARVDVDEEKEDALDFALMEDRQAGRAKLAQSVGARGGRDGTSSARR